MYKHECPECLAKDCKNINISNGRCLNYITDNISSASHRFYRGLLLPALTEAMGETNNQYVHELILKPEWIYRKTGEYYMVVYGNFDEIPARYQGNARIITSNDLSIQNEKFSVMDYKIVGYIPSMASFTKEETKDFFLFCETMLMEIGGQIPTADNQEFANLRSKIIK